MKKLLQFSTVIVGEAHNPTILNPDFLAKEGIVPKSWGWEVKETLTTPPLAFVNYNNGVSITVEPSKLQVTDAELEGTPTNSKATEIAAAYVQTLKHIPYSAVGNNFQCAITEPHAKNYIGDRFLKDGPWNSETQKLDAAGVRLIYKINECDLRLSIDSGNMRSRETGTEQPIILVNANFSRKVSQPDPAKQATSHLRQSMPDWKRHQNLLEAIFQQKGTHD